jgi:phosphoribosylformylglycinamidine cyclo-ligase
MEPKTVLPGVAEHLQSTYNLKVRSKVGDYAGLFEFAGYQLVSSTDGVGTKISVACESMDPDCIKSQADHEGIGEDLVNHCVNDILVVGANPMFFLNYFGYSDDRAGNFMQFVIKGMARAARAVNVPIISGETAKMEGCYPYPHCAYDVVGTIVGWLDEARKLGAENVDPGDVLIGIPSSGVHTNGFTTIRKVFCGPKATEYAKGYWNEPNEKLGMSIRDACLIPHRCYYELVKPMLCRFPIRAIAHITGGGIEVNVRRVIGEHKPTFFWDNWKWPELFHCIRACGQLSIEQMRAEFNIGIGLVLVVPESGYKTVEGYLKSMGEQPVLIGRVA